MQTYFEIGEDGGIQLVGKLIKNISRARKMSVKDLANGYVSVSTKLGSMHIDSKCRPNEVETWTLS